MNEIGTLDIETNRCLLRPFKLEDATFLYANYASDDQVTAFLTWNTHPDIQTTIDYLKNFVPKYETKKIYTWAITLKEKPDDVIGGIELAPTPETDTVEVGYVLARRYWHQGYMSEVFKAVIHYFFDIMDGQKIIGLFEKNNVNSGLVMKGCHLIYIGEKKTFLPRKNRFADLEVFEITKEQYQSLVNSKVSNQKNRLIERFQINFKNIFSQ